MKDDNRWNKWRAWLGGDEPSGETIYAQVVEILAFRQVWDVFGYICTNAPDEVQQDATVLAWFRVGFARSQGLAVRRMADMRSDVRSLARLIDEVRRYPTVLSRERYAAAHPDAYGDGFTIVSGGGDHIDPRIPARDLDDLQAKTKRVRDWVNSYVAHLTASNVPKESPPLQEVHDAVDFVADLFGKYMGMIRGAMIPSGVTFEPWPYGFRFPWIADDDAFRDVMAKMDEFEWRRSNRQK
jgi:hypothetical protein